MFESFTEVKEMGTTITSIDKLRVDVFFNEQAHYYFQRDLAVELFREVLERLAIDQSLLRRYASLRGRWRRIREFLIDNIEGCGYFD